MVGTHTTKAAPSISAELARNTKAVEARIAGATSRFTGTMAFVSLLLALFGGWIAINPGLVPGVPQFVESPVVLAMAVPVAVIFLSTFVLIRQHRMAAEASGWAGRDLRTGLLTEHGRTHLAKLLAEVVERVDAARARDPELRKGTDAIAAEQAPSHG